MHGTPASTTSACLGSPCTALCPAGRPRTGRLQGSAFVRYRAMHNSPSYAAASLTLLQASWEAVSAWLRRLRMAVM